MQAFQKIERSSPLTPRVQRIWNSFYRGLRSWRGLVIATLVLTIAALAAEWSWLSAIGLAPLILSVAPCAVMCAIGACAMSRGSSSSQRPGNSVGTDTTSSRG